MTPTTPTQCIAFADTLEIARGDKREVALKVKKTLEADPLARVLIFNAVTSEVIDLDLRGSVENVVERALMTSVEPEERRGPGRPKLGVVAREVTLLPRHWEWLSTQPGGASVALRKLVEDARSGNAGRDRRRKAQESAYKFMSVMAGNEPGFEEALRALFAGRQKDFNEYAAGWPADVRSHAKQLAAYAFGAGD